MERARAERTNYAGRYPFGGLDRYVGVPAGRCHRAPCQDRSRRRPRYRFFLLNAQITTGPYAGGMPAAVSSDPHALEIRIDYVQHALLGLASLIGPRFRVATIRAPFNPPDVRLHVSYYCRTVYWAL